MQDVDKRNSAVSRAARALVAMSMDAPDGGYLGAESDLLRRLGISRPTLRQADKIVESDQMLEVKRGLNGGFFARRPEARHAMQGPAFYLRLNGATLQHASAATGALMRDAVTLAAACQDLALRADLTEILHRLEAIGSDAYTTRQLVEIEAAIVNLILRMSGNPCLELFVQITYEFGALERDLRFYETVPSRKAQWRGLQLEICRAVLAGDAQAAEEVSLRSNATIASWLREDSVSTG